MNVSNNIQQSNYLQSSSSVQSQSAMSGFSPEASQSSSSNTPIMDTTKFSDLAQLLSQQYNNGERGERKENDGDGDDKGLKRNQAKMQENNSQELNSLLQSNNKQQSTDFQSMLTKNILSAYGITNSGTSMRA